MKPEYDFSKAERGKFYREDVKLRLPIYLDQNLQDQVEELAARTGQDVGVIVNRIIEEQVRLLETLGVEPSA